MNLDAVITQLKTYAQVFNNNVAGGAQYELGISDQVWLPTPACYVVPLEEDAGPNLDKTANGLRQIVTERVGVIVQLDNSADRRGQSSAVRLDTFRDAVNRALLNWGIDPSRGPQGLYYGGGERMGADRARFFYQLTYCFDATFDHTDGFQPPTGVPLVSFHKTYTDPATGTVLAVQTANP